MKRCKKTLEKSGGRIFTSPSESLSKIFPPISFNFLPFEITNAGEVLSFKLGFLINAGRWICSLILSVQLYRRRRQTSSSPFFSSLDARNSRNAPPLSIIVSSVGERMGTALLFPCYAERLVFVFRFVCSFFTFWNERRERSQWSSSKYVFSGGRARYLSGRLPLLHERAPVPASGITRRAFPGLGATYKLARDIFNGDKWKWVPSPFASRSTTSRPIPLQPAPESSIRN